MYEPDRSFQSPCPTKILPLILSATCCWMVLNGAAEATSMQIMENKNIGTVGKKVHTRIYILSLHSSGSAAIVRDWHCRGDKSVKNRLSPVIDDADTARNNGGKN